MLGYMGTDLGTIVVVEDDTNISDLVDLYLRREGFRVIQAGTGEAGLAAIEREHPRMAILDVGLPGPMDGLELAHAIRGRWPPIHLIVTSGKARERELPVYARFIRKPYSESEVRNALDELFAAGASRR